MPSALAMTRSSGVVTNPRTRSAFAPVYVVVARTTAISERGNGRTLSERIACNPAMRMTRLTTIAATGRLMNRSVNFISAVLRLGVGVVGRLSLVVDHDCGPVAQLEDAGGHDFLPRLEPAED